MDGLAGNDRFSADAGNDRLTGGAGADEFDFGFGQDPGHDVITDFSASQGDSIVVYPELTFTYDDAEDGFVTLDFEDGATVHLLGITAANFNPAWVVYLIPE